MNDYFNLLNEYQELQTNLKNQEDYKNTINDYIKTFINSISSLAIQDNKKRLTRLDYTKATRD